MAFQANMKEASKELPPEGQYELTIMQTEEKISKSGHNYVSVKYHISKGEFLNKSVYENISFHPNILSRTKSFLVIIGQDCEGENTTIDCTLWVGRKLNAQLKHDEYNGKHKLIVLDHLPMELTSIPQENNKFDTNDVPF